MVSEPREDLISSILYCASRYFFVSMSKKKHYVVCNLFCFNIQWHLLHTHTHVMCVCGVHDGLLEAPYKRFLYRIHSTVSSALFSDSKRLSLISFHVASDYPMFLNFGRNPCSRSKIDYLYRFHDASDQVFCRSWMGLKMCLCCERVSRSLTAQNGSVFDKIFAVISSQLLFFSTWTIVQLATPTFSSKQELIE